MNKIEELTKEQIDQMPKYVEKWTKKGLHTEPINKEAARKFAPRLYAFLGRENKNPEVIFANGPKDAWEIIEKIHDSKIKFVWPYLDGQYWAPYLAWYYFYKEVVGLTLTTDISLIEELIQFGNIYPLEDKCIFAESLKTCKRNVNGLHCDGGPALEYHDGTIIYSLNGVQVPDWLALTPAGKLDVKQFASIQNTEVRREFIRKIGIERLCTELHATLVDKKGDYELLDVDLGGRTGVWPYLKCLNPSIEVWHMECVDRACRTVDQALAFRNNLPKYVPPEILT